ncbi:MAG: DUF2764 family protein, partial [Rikenellaceae bacterium]|nr:DUF2764 family protein [Rikenellaceae bacterium]
GLLEEIRSQLSKKDNALMEFLLDGWDSEKLGEDFYLKAAASNNDFVRDYFEYDLGLRNAKVSYLNKALGRPEGQDIMILPHDSTKYEEIKDFEDAAKAVEVLGQNDILGRERGLDDLLWAKIDELTVMHVFDIDVILGFVCKLKIVDRWLSLDEATGREYFRKLVKDLRKGVEGKFEGEVLN